MIVVDLLMRNCWTVHVCTSSWPRSTEWNAGPVLLGAAALEGVGKYLGPETNVGSLHGLALPFLRPPVRRFLRFLTHRRRVHWARWRWSTGIGLTLQEAFLNDLPQLGDLGFLAANFGQKMIDWCHVCLCHTLLGLHCTRHREQHVKQMKQNAKTLENLFGENPQRIQNFLSIRHDSLERLNEDRAALKSGILTRQKLLHVAQLANDTNRRYQSQTNNGCFH